MAQSNSNGRPSSSGPLNTCNILVDGFVLPQHPFDAELFFSASFASFTHLLGSMSIRQHPVYGFGKCSSVCDRHDKAGLLVQHDLRNTAGLRRHHGEPCCHGFEESDAKALFAGGQDEEVEGTEKLRHVVTIPEESDVFFDTERAGLPSKICSKPALPNDDEHGARVPIDYDSK